jgi:hypothetical protein
MGDRLDMGLLACEMLGVTVLARCWRRLRKWRRRVELSADWVCKN